MRKFCIFILLFLIPALSSAQLIPDSSFGTYGRIYYGLPDMQYTRCLDVKICRDHSLITLMAGYQGNTYQLSLVKFKASGEIDSGFGYSGIMPLSVYGNDLKSGKLLLDSAGRIYTWGWGVNYFPSNPIRTSWLMRFDTAGFMDTAFHPLEDLVAKWPYLKNGCVTFSLRPDGKYYFNGNYYKSLWRFNSNHKPDSTFGGDGRVDSVCNCAEGIFESPDGGVNATGMVEPGNFCGVFIMDRHGNKDLKRTLKGWLVTDCGVANNLAPGKYAVSHIKYATNGHVQIHSKVFRDAFTAPLNFGVNGKISSNFDSACAGTATGMFLYRKNWYLALWNRYEYDDNMYYVRHRGGVSLFDSTGRLLTGMERKGNPYLLPGEKNNYSVLALDFYEDGSILAGMNIWNNGSHAGMLVKFKAPELKPAQNNGIQNHNMLNCSAYPNPTAGSLYIELPKNETIKTVALYDLNGRTIAAEVINRWENRWQLQSTWTGWCTAIATTESGNTARAHIFFCGEE